MAKVATMLQFPQRANSRGYPKKIPPIRKNKQRFWAIRKIVQSIFNYIRIYFKHSSMHGLKYVFKSDASFIEKFLWLSLLIVCHLSCLLLGMQSVERFRNKSTVMGLERDYYYWNTSIPSLTVCPMDRLDFEKVEKYCGKQNITDSECREFFDFTESLANATYFNFQNIRGSTNIDKILKRLHIKPRDYIELIYNLTTNFIHDKARGSKIYASDGQLSIRIRQVLTEYGICYMTNSILGLEYSTDFAIYGRLPQQSDGTDNVVDVVKGSFFDADITIDFMGFSGRGVDSYLHSTNEVSRVDTNVGFSADVMQYEAFCMEITCDDDFEYDVVIKQRNCRFHHESNLTHFPIYTKNLCIQECRLNFAMEQCGCIPHFYPNRFVQIQRPVCDYKTLQSCFPKLESQLLQLYRWIDNKKVPLDCPCLSNCEDTIVTLKRIVQLTATKSLFSDTNGARLTVNTWPKQRLKRQVVYSFSDLMVSLGSTAGLLLGFSVLSAFEFIYFFTLRLFFHIRGIKI